MTPAVYIYHMYRMKMVTAFEESFSTTNKPSNPSTKDYDQALQVLQHDINVAKNAFARGAKKELKQLLTERVKHGFSAKQASECRDLSPFWVSDTSVTISVLEMTTYKGVNFSEVLSRLVEALAAAIIDQVGDHPLTLVDSLQTHISTIGIDIYQFRLKQKWTIGKAPVQEKP